MIRRVQARGRAIVLAVAFSALVLPLVARAQRPVPGSDPKYPRMKYADSLVSKNDRCMVRHTPLNPKIRPVYVNGNPIGFC